MINYLLPTLIFLFFSITHTYWASDSFKLILFKKVSDFRYYYRFTYSIISLLNLGLWYYFIPRSSFIFYKLDFSISIVFYLVQIIAIIGLIHAVLISYPRIFIGVHQLFDRNNQNYFLDEPVSKTTLRINSIYKYVRHPMYFWSIIYVCFTPTMSDRNAYIAIIFILYFYFGTFPEEKKLELRFGDQYKLYKKQVPRLVPNFIKYFKS
jgi:methanethiol S-methyltransferase